MGYVLAGTALEASAGKTWDAIDQPWGHKAGITGTKPMKPEVFADNPTSMGPAGTVHCSLEDWATCVRAHMGSGPDGYLSADALARLNDPPQTAGRMPQGGVWWTRRGNRARSGTRAATR